MNTPLPKLPTLLLACMAWLSLSATALAQSRNEPGERAWMGLYIRDVDTADIQALDLDPGMRGVLVSGVDDEGPAAKAGLEPGDVITQFDGRSVGSRVDFMTHLGRRTPGDDVRLQIARGQQEFSFEFALESRPHVLEGQALRVPGRRNRFDVFGLGGPRLGVQTLDLESDALASYFGVRAGDGVLVTSVVEDSGADAAGILPGDVILAVEGETIGETAAIRKALEGLEEDDRVTVRLRRENHEQEVSVELTQGFELPAMGFSLPGHSRSWRFDDDIGDLKQELRELKRDLRQLEREMRRKK